MAQAADDEVMRQAMGSGGNSDEEKDKPVNASGGKRWQQGGQNNGGIRAKKEARKGDRSCTT